MQQCMYLFRENMPICVLYKNVNKKSKNNNKKSVVRKKKSLAKSCMSINDQTSNNTANGRSIDRAKYHPADRPHEYACWIIKTTARLPAASTKQANHFPANCRNASVKRRSLQDRETFDTRLAGMHGMPRPVALFIKLHQSWAEESWSEFSE